MKNSILSALSSVMVAVLIVAILSLTVMGAADIYDRKEENSWRILHAPAAATQATISKAAASGLRHVCKGFMATFAGNNSYVIGTAPSTATLTIRDGATGAGTILWEGIVSLCASGTTTAVLAQTGLYLVGTANTAMTIEFTAAGASNTNQMVSLFGESIPN